MGIKVGADPEMTPRRRIVSVAYAIISQDADKLDGKEAADFAEAIHSHDDRYYTEFELNSSDGNPPNQGSNRMNWNNLKDVPEGFADGVDNVGAGSGGWVDDGTVVRLETITDNVGIGTTSPNSKLEVIGLIHSTSGGFKFPDGSIQSTAAIGGNGTVTSLSHGNGIILSPNPITETGTISSSLGTSISSSEIENGAVTSSKIQDGTITTADLNFTPITSPYNGSFTVNGPEAVV